MRITKKTQEEFRELPLQDQVEHLLRANRVLKSTIARSLRDGVTTELAKMLLRGRDPTDHESVAPVFAEALISQRKAFPQKRAHLLDFYAQVFSLMPRPPARILEIGVKGGVSLELWKAVFPRAQIVGADIKLLSRALPEGITLVEADQSRPETIAALGEYFGPFDFVVDDGSHIGEHMINSLVALLPHLNAGSVYVLEDIFTRGRNADDPDDDGKIGELIAAAVGYFGRTGKWGTSSSSVREGSKLILPHMAGLLLGHRVMAFLVNQSGASRNV
jgi:predicted O-methyltransferase YrrM